MRLALFLLLIPTAWAQFTGTASYVRPVTSLPATCKPATGAVVFLTTGTIGVYNCTATNTWAIPGGTSSAGWSDDGTTITATAGRNVSLSGLLYFGGTTSSFPALKRSSTLLQFRLADDSGYAGLSAVSLAIGSDAAKFTVSSTGQTVVGANLFASQFLSSFSNFGAGVGGAYVGSDKTYSFSSTTDATGTKDLLLSRLAAGALGAGVAVGGMSATIQSGVTASDPGCTTTAHVGKLWFDITTTTTALKVCMNIAGTLTWVVK